MIALKGYVWHVTAEACNVSDVCDLIGGGSAGNTVAVVMLEWQHIHG